MLRSMTAFARHEHHQNGLKVVWELRTVNHRYLDVHLRLPEMLRQFEPQVRASLQKKLQRGRVDVTTILESSSGETGEQIIDELAIQAIKCQQVTLKKVFTSARDLSVYELMQLPGTFNVNSLEGKPLQKAVFAGLDIAQDQLLAAREQEGEKIQKLLANRLFSMAEISKELREQMPSLERGLINRWQNKLAELRGADAVVAGASDRAGIVADGLDEARLNQEMALLMTKSDVAEELDRLDVHIEECGQILEKGGAVGRRLDFMMQELNREANTLGSKAYHQAMTSSSIELKVLIDQMREQIQNIE